MPKLSGLEAAAQIPKVMPLVPIVLYTMHEYSQLEAEAKKIGIRKVLSKVNSSTLVAALEEIFGKPHDIGPLGVSDEYTQEPVRGEGAFSTKTNRTSEAQRRLATRYERSGHKMQLQQSLDSCALDGVLSFQP